MNKPPYYIAAERSFIMQYTNPILPGFHPDPSICRVGDDFYLVTSTFEYFPGIPVFHSRDLVHWEQIGHCLTRDSQVKLVPGAPNCLNIYAPTIRYHEGTFYVIVTNVTGDNHGNFIVTATDPSGEWSDPIALPFPGIDPSLFFDDDGKVYYLGTDCEVYLNEVNIQTGEAIGEPHLLWQGTANNPEGPHLYKIDGMYYLLIAQGGTEMCHMAAMARSKNILGPYEPCPHNPVLTNIGHALPIKAAGHADLVDDPAGNWWAVCLGNRPLAYPFRHNLGRETMLVPVKKENGWFYMGAEGAVLTEFDVPELPAFQTAGYVPGSAVEDHFDSTALHPSWNYIYNPVPGLIQLTGKQLQLWGNAARLSEDTPKTWLGRRQEHFCCTAEADITFAPERDGEEAGLTVYMNPGHHYEIAKTRLDGKPCIIVRRRIGSLQAVENVIPCNAEQVTLRLECSRDWYRFFFAADGGEMVLAGSGETQYLTTEAGGCFTGNYIALFASGNGAPCETPADVTAFRYLPQE